VFLAWWGITRHPQLATYDIMENLWPIVHEKFSAEEIWGWCRDALIECARYASDSGVTLALQNHRPVIKDYPDVLRMVKEVNSPNLKVCLDAPLMLDKSAKAMREAAHAVGSLQVLSHFGGEEEADGRDAERWGAPDARDRKEPHVESEGLARGRDEHGADAHPGAKAVPDDEGTLHRGHVHSFDRTERSDGPELCGPRIPP